jgi:hypothetical protein
MSTHHKKCNKVHGSALNLQKHTALLHKDVYQQNFFAVFGVSLESRLTMNMKRAGKCSYALLILKVFPFESKL